VDPASTLPDMAATDQQLCVSRARPVQEIVLLQQPLETEVKACAVKKVALITVTIEVPQALDE